MKKAMIIFALAGIIAGCGGSGSNTEVKTVNEKTNAGDSQANDPEIQKGLELVAKNDCFTCHKIGEKLTGPAYLSVAEKYSGHPEMVDTLAQRVINGTQGTWGPIPMIKHPNLSMDDARTMVKYILSLKQQ